MRRSYALLLAVIAGALLLSPVSFAANILVNPGFESGPQGFGATGWGAFGNAYSEPTNPPWISPCNGGWDLKMYGLFTGSFSVSGIFQEFPSAPGDMWEMSSTALHWSGDPLLGVAGTGNWVVQKIAFFDAGNTEIGSNESTILDGSYAQDTCHVAAAIQALAPAGTVKVQALVLFLQPANDPGGVQVDDVSFELVSPVPTIEASWGQIKALYSN